MTLLRKVPPPRVEHLRRIMRRHEGQVDACIVGCGAAGAVLAKELSEGGLSVVVLEAGEWLDSREDFVNDELSMLGTLDWDDLRIVDGDDPIKTGRVNTGRAVGGSTVRFTAVSVRLARTTSASPRPMASPSTGRSATTSWRRTTPRSSGRCRSLARGARPIPPARPIRTASCRGRPRTRCWGVASTRSASTSR